jgi:general secretion pathway protein C
METVLQRWSWAALLAAAALCALLSARIVNTFAAAAIAPKPSLVLSGSQPGARGPEAPHVELNGDKLADAFGIPRPPPPLDPTAAPVPVAPVGRPDWSAVPVRSALRGVLVGTAIADPSRWSLCQLTNGDTNETLVYAVGDHFLAARIYRVEKDRVLLDNEGRNEYIDNSAAGASPNLGVAPVPPPPSGGGDGVKQLSENNYSVSKKEIDKALNNLSELATQARIVPSFKNGVSNGFKLFSIVPDSLYSKIGVQNGDVIHKINGYEMNSPDKALEIYQKLRDATRIEIELERRGETVRKQYSIE